LRDPYLFEVYLGTLFTHPSYLLSSYLFVWGPLSFEYTVVRLFMYQRLIGLLILLVRDPSILVEDLLHFDWGPLPFEHTESYFRVIILVWLLIFRLKTQKYILLITA